jgi:extracellular solute-binding protein
MMALLLTGAPGMAAEINVMSGDAPKEALAILIPRFEKLTGHHVKMTYAVIAALQQKLAAGETPDMVLLPTSAVADLARTGNLKSDGSRPFGTIRIVAIKSWRNRITGTLAISWKNELPDRLDESTRLFEGRAMTTAGKLDVAGTGNVVSHLPAQRRRCRAIELAAKNQRRVANCRKLRDEIGLHQGSAGGDESFRRDAEQHFAPLLDRVGMSIEIGFVEHAVR